MKGEIFQEDLFNIKFEKIIYKARMHERLKSNFVPFSSSMPKQSKKKREVKCAH